MDVLVVDAERRFVEYVSPAVARRALKDGAAKVFRKAPFSIQLPPGVDRCPRTFNRANRNNMTAFSDIFQDEQEVWVRVLVPGQVSLEFQDRNGNAKPVRISGRDPVRLTDQVSFEDARNSTDLRTLINPRRNRAGDVRPAALQLMTIEQVEDYFAKKAERRKIYKKAPDGSVLKGADGSPVLDIEAAKQPRVTHPAVDAAPTTVGHTESPTAKAMREAEEVSSVKDSAITMAEAIDPQVLQMCHTVKTAEQENERPLAEDMIDVFETLDLKEDSLNHILAYGHYASVKTWATQRLEEVAA